MSAPRRRLSSATTRDGKHVVLFSRTACVPVMGGDVTVFFLEVDGSPLKLFWLFENPEEAKEYAALALEDRDLVWKDKAT